MRTEFKTKTKREAWKRCGERCEGLLSSGERCDAPLKHKPHHFDHIIPDAIGGPNDLQNCAVLCVPCHDDKTRHRDMRIIAKAKRNYDKDNGIRSGPKLQGRGFQRRPPQRTASRPIERKSEAR